MPLGREASTGLVDRLAAHPEDSGELVIIHWPASPRKSNDNVLGERHRG